METEGHVKFQVDTAQKRLNYFSELKVWCDNYVHLANRRKADVVQIDNDMLAAVEALRARLTVLVLKDGIETAKHEITGENTWQNPPQF